MSVQGDAQSHEGIGQHLGPVTARQRFDHSALERWMRENIEEYEGSMEVRQFAGGASNPTFLLQSRNRRYVLRKKPPGQLLQSAHQVDREYRVMAALANTDVPVPTMRGFCNDPDVIGTTFYVMDFLEGRIFRDATLPGMAPSERAAIYDDCNSVLTKLHKVDWGAVGLEGFGKPGNYFERQIARWARQYRDAPLPSVDTMDLLIEELPKHIPKDHSVSIAHGDYRIENVMYHPREPRIIAVLDWELSTIGHPLADLGYTGALWHSHIARWGSLDNVDFESSGIPTEQQWVNAYCRRTGRDGVEGWNFLVAFSLFRVASISHGVHARAAAGITPRAQIGDSLCPTLSRQALDLLSRPDTLGDRLPST